ncbi:MAG: flotillin family protein [Chloroflexi bacterium]|nr:flotillin family protein [Chloroflexota bacterium]
MDGFVLILFGVMLVVFFLQLVVYAKQTRKVGPNEVLIISGRTPGPRMVTGGRTFVWPILERVDTLSLELMDIPLQLRHIKTKDGGTVSLTATAQVKIGSDEISIRTASIQLLSKPITEIKQIAQDTLVGQSKTLIRILTADSIDADREAVSQKIQEISGESLACIGLEIVSLVIQEVEVRVK